MVRDIKLGPGKHNPPNQELWYNSFLSAVTKEIDLASEEAMRLNGYVVVAYRIDDEKWIVKKYKDGTIEKLSKI